MRVAATIVLGLAWASIGCATALDDPSAQLADGGRHVDTGVSVDDVGAGGDTLSANDSGSTSRDTGSSSLDTGVDFDSGSSAPDSDVVGFDTGTSVPDFGVPDTAPPPPPPSDGGAPTCTTDAECGFPYNCCQVLAGACGIYIGPLCFPLS